MKLGSLKSRLNNQKKKQIKGKSAKFAPVFIRNKANLKNIKIGVSSFETSKYEILPAWQGKKQTQFKANTNPILAQKSGGQSQFKPKQTQFPAFSFSIFICSGYNLQMQKWTVKKLLNPVSRDSIFIILLACSFVLSAKSQELNPPEEDWFVKATALPLSKGPTIEVSDVQQLINALIEVEPGQTILLGRLGRLIRTVFTNDGLMIANNLLNRPGIRNESKSEISFSNNLIRDFTDVFIDPANGNLHLKKAANEAVDKGIPLTEIKEDIDGELRRARPDIGADELKN